MSSLKMSSSVSSQESGCSSPTQCQEDTLQQQTASISSYLQQIPYSKLTELRFINKGAYGTVHRALHADWRTDVAVKFFPTERLLVESDRNKILKEAEILHKARFSYILPILGICYNENNIGIVTEYMTSGSLNQLLHEENPSPEIVWPLRFRILYEIALGVNFLHNLTPPLLHHDLKTPNILLDNEFHVKIADFGLSKWRMLSQSLSDQKPAGGTIIYMPPEMYRPSGTNCRGNVKHDMYSYAIIMWEVLSRKQPFEGAVDQMQIMYSVSIGDRPDTSERSLPADIPHRDVFVSIMQSGWACDPNERPAFLKCLLDLEPVIRRYDDISILEGILKIKRVRNQILSISQNISVTSDSATTTLPMTESTPQSINPSPSSPDIYLEKISIHPSGPPTRHSGYESPVVSLPFRPCSDSLLVATPFETYGPQAGPSCTLTWVQSKRDQIVMKMTEACLNQCLDSLIARSVIIKEDYELIKSRSTRSEKVRKLIDTCDSKGELFAKIIVQKLKDNRQSDLQPFPEI